MERSKEIERSYEEAQRESREQQHRERKSESGAEL